MTIRLYPQEQMSVTDIVRESNGIEDIFRDPSPAEMEAFYEIMNAKIVTVSGLTDFVIACTGIGAPLRDRIGLDVQVGDCIAPPGGIEIAENLEDLLDETDEISAYELYLRYENLHPFVDGNGRSGRALYHRRLGPNGRSMRIGFLRDFHYRVLASQQ